MNNRNHTVHPEQPPGDIYRQFVERSPYPVLMYKLAYGRMPGRFFEVNEDASSCIGYTRRQFLKMRPRDLEAKDQAPWYQADKADRDYVLDGVFTRRLVDSRGHESDVEMATTICRDGRRTVGVMQIFFIKHVASMLDINRQQIYELQRHVRGAKVLKGKISICINCRKIETPSNRWVSLETFLQDNSLTHFSHGYCPECGEVVMREIRRGTRHRA